MQLKESMIEQIMTMEQYKNIAYMWYRESIKLGKLDNSKSKKPFKAGIPVSI
jgi:hypothetical protein